jgi:ABC-2 type transport system permease protein/lipopolysaccharide transport system permease protein
VYLRDLRHALPQAIQLGFFVTPIIWSLSGISAGWQVVVCAINPNAAVIDGLRRSVLYGETPNLGLTAIAAVVSVLWLVGSFLLFKRLETGFADVS